MKKKTSVTTSAPLTRVTLPNGMTGIYYPITFKKLELLEGGLWKLHLDQTLWPQKIRGVYSMAIIPSPSGFDDRLNALHALWNSPQRQLGMDEKSFAEDCEKVQKDFDTRWSQVTANIPQLPLSFVATTLKYDRTNFKTKQMMFWIQHQEAMRISEVYRHLGSLSLLLVGEDSPDWKPGSDNHKAVISE